MVKGDGFAFHRHMMICYQWSRSLRLYKDLHEVKELAFDRDVDSEE